jgi:hypothetical protein
MLPRRYYPQWQGNVYERRTAQIAAQLCGDGMTIDYDQLLAKQPYKHDAIFAWHQDMAYWPDTPDRRTATFWLAVDDSTLENGCMRFVPATNHETELRPHAPVYGGRGTSHALGTDLREGDQVVVKPIARGDCTVHNERVMHGSGTSPGVTAARTSARPRDSAHRAVNWGSRTATTTKVGARLGARADITTVPRGYLFSVGVVAVCTFVPLRLRPGWAASLGAGMIPNELPFISLLRPRYSWPGCDLNAVGGIASAPAHRALAVIVRCHRLPSRRGTLGSTCLAGGSRCSASFSRPSA